MDGNYSLNATRPAWEGFIGHEPEGQQSSTFDTARTGLGEPATLNSASQHADNDGERVAYNNRTHQDSRPVDFLKLVGLWAKFKQQGQVVQDFRAEGSTSMKASKTLGRGLSFNVHLVRVDGKVKDRLQLRSPYVVYKTLRGLNDQLGTVERGQLLRAVLLEVRVLTHWPLRTHQNITRLIQLAWEPDPDHSDQAWPVLVLEYSENGTLADFQIDYPNLPFKIRKQLCQDIGRGLWALHSTGIVHGDLKSENVLISDTDDGSGVVAKLADFGCAVTDIDPSEMSRLPALTIPWNAPESRDLLPRDYLKYTDIYSYGLLIWRMVLDGVNPFRHIGSLSSLSKEEFHGQVEKLKVQDLILPLAKATLRQPFLNVEECFLVASLLDSTLQLGALNRSLDRALNILGGQRCSSLFPIEPLMQHEYEDIDITALQADVAPMCLQRSILRELETLSTKTGKTGQLACSKLFEFYMERLEWPGAAESASRWYLKAVESDTTSSIAPYVEGVFESLHMTIPLEVDSLSMIKSSVRKGNYHSLLELRRRSPSDFPAALQEYRRHGRLLRHDTKHEITGCSPEDQFDTYFGKILVHYHDDSSALRIMTVSANDDLLLHAAARNGCARAVQLMLSLEVDINATNKDGETPLLQACRVGCIEVVRLLLSNGADAAIAARTAETPLHWLFTFDDDDLEQVAQLLFSQGGESCLHATVAAGQSSAVEDLALFGTPMHYAIKARNERAALLLYAAGTDPFLHYVHEQMHNPSTYTPFRLAIEELLLNTVGGIIHSPRSASSLAMYISSKSESILPWLMESSSKTMRRITIGAQYVSFLVRMIDLLRSVEPRHKELQSGVSLLHTCIIHGLPAEVIEYLLCTGSQEHLQLESSLHGHTPLQAAMQLEKWQTFMLLLDHGADIHKRLVFPEQMSYLQLCAHLGSRGTSYAHELISRGAIIPDTKWFDPDVREDTECLTQFSPQLFAVIMGNFDLATMLLITEGSGRIVTLTMDLLMRALRHVPRLPVSRLRYLLYPPEGVAPIPIDGFYEMNRNCFHAIAASPVLGDLEPLLNFRYLLEQSRAQGRPELINQVDDCGFPPLYNAILTGRLDLVKEMLEAGANPNQGISPALNLAHSFLKRLQKAPSQTFAALGGHTLTRRDARWLQDDYLAIISLLKQHGGREELTFGKPMMDPIAMLSNYRRVKKERNKQDYEWGKQKGKEMVEQEGIRKTIQFVWEGLSYKLTHPWHRDPTKHDTVSVRQGFQNSYMRYREDLARRNRFSSPPEDPGGPSGSQRGSTTAGKIEAWADFMNWYSSPPAQEVADFTPRLPMSNTAQHQGIHPQPGLSTPSQGHYPPPPDLDIGSNSQLQSYYGTPNNHQFLGAVGHPFPVPPRAPIQKACATHGYLFPQQAPSSPPQSHSPGTPYFHIHILSQEIHQIFSLYRSNMNERLSRFQECLDTYFGRLQERAAPNSGCSSAGAPLGSFFVFELEKGIHSVVKDNFDVLVLKRDGAIKVLADHPAKRTYGILEGAKSLKAQGWLGWKELEEQEAELLTASFEAL